jgi:hypothetical protein
VSKRWTVQNDSNIFVRKNALGYCYNLEWAGPLTKYEALKLSSSSVSTTIISIAKIRPSSRQSMIKYTFQIQLMFKALGIDNDEVQLLLLKMKICILIILIKFHSFTLLSRLPKVNMHLSKTSHLVLSLKVSLHVIRI